MSDGVKESASDKPRMFVWAKSPTFLGTFRYFRWNEEAGGQEEDVVQVGNLQERPTVRETFYRAYKEETDNPLLLTVEIGPDWYTIRSEDFISLYSEVENADDEPN